MEIFELTHPILRDESDGLNFLSVELIVLSLYSAIQILWVSTHSWWCLSFRLVSFRLKCIIFIFLELIIAFMYISQYFKFFNTFLCQVEQINITHVFKCSFVYSSAHPGGASSAQILMSLCHLHHRRWVNVSLLHVWMLKIKV